MVDTSPVGALTVAVLVGCDDGVIWGYATSERHRRVCRRAGVGSVVERADLPASGRVLLLRRDFILDENLLVALLASDGAVVVATDAAGVPRPVAAHVGTADVATIAEVIERGSLEGVALPSALRIGKPEEIGPSFNRKLRKRAQPYALQISPATRYGAEWRTFTEAYKGATDFVTKFLWPVPAFHVTRWCAAQHLTPNMVTTLGALLMLLATWLFWSGHVMLGLIPAWAMTFFDTVDGKLARCTLTSSRWGDIYDHGIDLLHPPFWWIAWWHGVQQVDGSVPAPLMDVSVVVIFVGYIVLRLQEAAFKSFFGIQTHIWRPIDYGFRAITSRRNPNLAILTVTGLLGAPAWGFVLVAVWTVVSVIFHFVRIGQAALVRSRGGQIASWLTEPVPSGLQG